jgi:hypothetical protein
MADGRHGLGVFAAGKAVGKDSIGVRRCPQRQIQPSGKRLAVGILKTECLEVHFFSIAAYSGGLSQFNWKKILQAPNLRQITNHKKQIPSKFQITKSKSQKWQKPAFDRPFEAY